MGARPSACCSLRCLLSLALVLAGVGLYSIVSYSVAVRVPEFGVRLAFGAQRRHILEDVLLRSGTECGSGAPFGTRAELRSAQARFALGGLTHSIPKSLLQPVPF